VFNNRPHYKEHPVKADGEVWLVDDQQQQVVRFRNDMATVHAQWVTLSTYSWKQLKPPVPMTQRRMLRHNAIEAWNAMKKTGRRPCRAPVLGLSGKPFSEWKTPIKGKAVTSTVSAMKDKISIKLMLC
tara:strand:- start:74 stop:457 length:384 start_codon:yes stop_codon:yes gene_type:complete